MIEFTYTFEEAALIREPGLRAGLVGGEADIRIVDETTGEWSIAAIRLDGMRDGSRDVSLSPIADLDRNSWLFTALHSELESAFKDAIEDRVAEELGMLVMEAV